MDEARVPHVVHIYSLSNYGFGQKPEKQARSKAEQLLRMQERHAAEGARRTVEAVLLVNEHRHPHVLLLQVSAASEVCPRDTRVPDWAGLQVDKDTYTLPGGKLKPGEEEVDGLKRKLRVKLAPSAAALGLAQPEWHVGELLATWTRPQFEPHIYPYCPPHVTRPVETRKVYVVHLPDKCFFAVPKNLKLLAVPLMELHSGAAKFGVRFDIAHHRDCHRRVLTFPGLLPLRLTWPPSRRCSAASMSSSTAQTMRRQDDESKIKRAPCCVSQSRATQPCAPARAQRTQTAAMCRPAGPPPRH